MTHNIKLHRLPSVLAFAVALSCGALPQALAREASFMEPGTKDAVVQNTEAVKVDPRPDIDVGETTVSITKHVSVVFVNQNPTPVKVESVTLNADANIVADAAGNDCAKQGTISPGNRCTVDVTLTPSSPGAWNVDVMLTHDGAGRIARAKLSGKTSGTPIADHKDAGLAVSAQEIRPIDFGDINIGDNKIVRSTLMINDSPTPITIYAIDVIEADNGLQRLDQGCAVDMELAPGASCPVTLIWQPKNPGPISTDLIIRHSGRLGFAVIPVRGVAKGEEIGDGKGSKMPGGKNDIVPMPLSAKDLEKEMAGKVTPLPSEALVPTSMPVGKIYLIGTIGTRALFLKPDNDTAVAEVGDIIDLGDNKTAKLIAVSPNSAAIIVDGKRRDLKLESVPSLVAGAQEAAKASAASAPTASSSSSSASSKGGSSVPLKTDTGGTKK